jgi:hypothetical protein
MSEAPKVHMFFRGEGACGYPGRTTHKIKAVTCGRCKNTMAFKLKTDPLEDAVTSLLSVYIPLDLHRELKSEAARRGMSLRRYVTHVLSRRRR